MPESNGPLPSPGEISNGVGGISPAPAGGQGDLTVLSDPHRMKSDMNLIRRAVRQRWAVADDRRPVVVDRLLEIVERRTVDVPCGEGVFPSAYHADANALKAAAVLRGMEQDNQRDEHHADDLEVARANAVSNAANAGLVKKDYYGLDPDQV